MLATLLQLSAFCLVGAEVDVVPGAEFHFRGTVAQVERGSKAGDAQKSFDLTLLVTRADGGGTDYVVFDDITPDAPIPLIERGVDFRIARVADLMTREPRRIAPERLAIDCVETMERAPKVTQLLVVDGRERLVGALHLHDLFRARVI